MQSTCKVQALGGFGGSVKTRSKALGHAGSVSMGLAPFQALVP